VCAYDSALHVINMIRIILDEKRREWGQILIIDLNALPLFIFSNDELRGRDAYSVGGSKTIILAMTRGTYFKAGFRGHRGLYICQRLSYFL
jgi:hypothetical protein